jgi:hypothetical protein
MAFENLDEFAAAMARSDDDAKKDDQALDKSVDVNNSGGNEDDNRGDDNNGGADDGSDTGVDGNSDNIGDDLTWGKALGIDDSVIQLDDEGNLKGFVTNVNGVTETVDIQSLLAGYQINKNNTIKAQAIAEERKQFEQIRDTVAAQYVDRLNTVDLMIGFLNNQLIGDAKNVDWEKLRAENPGEYAAKVQDFNLRKQELAQYFQAAEQEKARLQQEAEGTNKERSEAFFKEQADLLIQNNPDWKDPVKMQSAFNDMSKFAFDTYGFSPQEFNTVADARIFNLLQDAMKYRRGVQVADKKIKQDLPKFQKSAGKSVKSNTKLQALTERAKKASGSGKRHAETDAIAELLISEGVKL